MAVTEVKNPQDFHYRMTTDHRGRSTYAMRWEIDTDDQLMPAPLVAIAAQATDQGFASPLPARWASYSFQGATDPYAFFKGNLQLYKPEPTTKPTRWWAEGTYEPLDEGQQSGAANTDPLARPIDYHTEVEPFSEVIEEDKDGNPLLNAAGHEFTDIPEEQGFYDVLVATKNLADLAAVVALQNQYRYSTNTDVFYGAPARHAKIDAIPSGQLITEGATSYYRVQIRITFRHKPWDKKYLNQGFQVKDTNPGSPTFGKTDRAVDFNGKPTPEPVLLEPDGSRLPENTVGNYREFRVRREVAYSGLGV